MTFISAKINQNPDPKQRLQQRLEHDQDFQEVQLHDHQQRPEDGQIIPSTFQPPDLDHVVA